MPTPFASYTFTFGKHNGKSITDVPLEYLEWLVGDTKGRLTIFESEIQRREDVATANVSLVEKLVDAGYKALAKKYHPDTNANDPDAARMFRAIQAAHTVLQQILDEKGITKK